MDLPNLLNKFKSTAEEPKKFIAIEIGFDAVKTAIWQSNGVHTEIVSIGSVQSWSSSETDDLITAIDTSLADAQTDVLEEPNQVIFGLPEIWVDDDGIAETKKSILKKICKRLDLKAIGYVVTTEAMVHHLREVEGGPPSAILLQIGASEIAVSLIYLGKLETTQVVGRSTNIANDVEEGLARIPHSGHLPSRIILLTNLDDPEPIKQELISFDWQKKLEFLHFPKVESLTKDWSIKSISVAGGAEVIESLGFENVTQSANQVSDKPPVVVDTPKDEIVDQPPVIPPEATSEPEPEPDLGFKQVDFSANPQINTGISDPPEPSLDNIEPVIETPKSAKLRKPFMETSQKLLIGFGRRVKSLVIKPQTKSTTPPLKNSKKWLIPIIIIISLLALTASGIYGLYKIPTANIDVYVALNPFQQQLTFTIDPAQPDGNMESSTVAGVKIDLEKIGSKTIATTGTKMVGDRAKGKVTIYNRTTAPKTLPAGTILKTDVLRFTLDTNVTVASASSKENADFSITTEPAKIEAAVTSADIGEQYNIAKDTQLSVANFSNDNFLAVAVSTFAGGSARQVAAVSQEDIDNLKSTLTQELQDQINQNSTSSQDEGKRQINVGEPTIVSEKYSSVKGAEADELTLDLSLSQTVYQYDVAQLSLIAQQTATQSLPENVQLTPNNTEINTLTTIIKEDNRAEVTAQVVLQYIPRIETNQYTKELAFLPLDQIEAKLSTIPNYQKHDVDGKYLLFNRLPITSNQITMHIKPVSKTE